MGMARPPRASPCGLAALVRVPLTLTRRGTVWMPAQVVEGRRSAPHRPRTGHTPRASLRLLAPLSLGAKGAGRFPSLCPSGFPPARE